MLQSMTEYFKFNGKNIAPGKPSTWDTRQFIGLFFFFVSQPPCHSLARGGERSGAVPVSGQDFINRFEGNAITNMPGYLHHAWPLPSRWNFRSAWSPLLVRQHNLQNALYTCIYVWLLSRLPSLCLSLASCDINQSLRRDRGLYLPWAVQKTRSTALGLTYFKALYSTKSREGRRDSNVL